MDIQTYAVFKQNQCQVLLHFFLLVELHFKKQSSTYQCIFKTLDKYRAIILFGAAASLICKNKEQWICRTDANSKGFKNYITVLSFQREDKYSATEKSAFPFNFLWLNPLPREALVTEEAGKLDIDVWERKKQIASSQTLLQLAYP